MTKFEIAYSRTAQLEGGYVNIKSDNGGETYCGISRKNNPDFIGWKIINSYKSKRPLQRGEIIKDSVLESLIKSFYKAKYYDSNNLESINNQEIINEIYDTGVNMGIFIAAKFVQQSLNLLNRNQKDYPDLKEDGKLGIVTMGILNKYPNPSAFIKTLNGLQFMRYVDICLNDPAQEENFLGWLKRI